MPQRKLRSLLEWTRGKARARPILGTDSWLEISHKLFTVVALCFGAWAYFHSVHPVFEKEKDLQTQRERAGTLAREVNQLKLEKTALESKNSDLQQRLYKLELQSRITVAAVNRRGAVLYHLSKLRRDLQTEILAYQRRAPGELDLRGYSLAYTDTILRMLGPAKPRSPESYKQEALYYFRQFVNRNILPEATDLRSLNDLLDAYDQQDKTP